MEPWWAVSARNTLGILVKVRPEIAPCQCPVVFIQWFILLQIQSKVPALTVNSCKNQQIEIKNLPEDQTIEIKIPLLVSEVSILTLIWFDRDLVSPKMGQLILPLRGGEDVGINKIWLLCKNGLETVWCHL